MIKSEQTYLSDYINHIHSCGVELNIKQLLRTFSTQVYQNVSNFQYCGLSKVACKKNEYILPNGLALKEKTNMKM